MDDDHGVFGAQRYLRADHPGPMALLHAPGSEVHADAEAAALAIL
jgi:hypothetical protein